MSTTKRPRLSGIPSRLKPIAEAVQAGDSWRVDVGGSSSARGYTYQWQVARLEHLQREPLCRMCKARGFIVEATVVDHIKPHNGDMVLFWDRTNWQSLCKACHDRRKQRIERAASHGRKQ